MSLDAICRCCGSQCAAFTKNAHFSQMCTQCFSLSRQGLSDVRIYKALGVLKECDLMVGDLVLKLYKAGFRNAESLARPLKMKTKALIRHDRILNGGTR